MEKIILFVLFSTSTIMNISCQENNFLVYFPLLEHDSVFNTIDGQKLYYESLQKESLPDFIVLNYIFNNNKDEIYGIEEGYNVDTDEYFTTTYVKKVYPIFKKIIGNKYLLCYGLESIMYLCIYDLETNKITNREIISDFSDEMGNIIVHSIIFSNNYILKAKIEESVNFELIKICLQDSEFKITKQITIDNFTQNIHEIFEKSFPILEITSKGEPLK